MRVSSFLEQLRHERCGQGEGGSGRGWQQAKAGPKAGRAQVQGWEPHRPGFHSHCLAAVWPWASGLTPLGLVFLLSGWDPCSLSGLGVELTRPDPQAQKMKTMNRTQAGKQQHGRWSNNGGTVSPPEAPQPPRRSREGAAQRSRAASRGEDPGLTGRVALAKAGALSGPQLPPL